MNEQKMMDKLDKIHEDVIVCKTKIEAHALDLTDHELRIRKSESFKWKMAGGWASLGILVLWAKIKSFLGMDG